MCHYYFSDSSWFNEYFHYSKNTFRNDNIIVPIAIIIIDIVKKYCRNSDNIFTIATITFTITRMLNFDYSENNICNTDVIIIFVLVKWVTIKIYSSQKNIDPMQIRWPILLVVYAKTRPMVFIVRYLHLSLMTNMSPPPHAHTQNTETAPTPIETD